MAKITYTNKNKAGTGDALLWKDADANQVKTSVNAIYDTTLTITGTTNQITATGGVQNLESNRLWTISLPTNICTGIISATTCFVGSGAGLTGTASSLTAIPASHTHGDISNTGRITSTAITPASGDYILLSDTTASGSIKRGIVLGSSTTTFLANNGTWLTPAGGTGGASELSGLTDVTLTTPSTGQLLCRHSDGQWINFTSSYLTSLAHVHCVANSAGTNQFSYGVGGAIRFAGAGGTTVSFTPASCLVTFSSSTTGGGGATQLNELSDVTLTTPSTGQLLCRHSDGKWINWTPTYGGGVSEAMFSSHTGNTNCHFTQASISITTSQISNLSSYTGFDTKYPSITNFNSHTGNTDCHFTQAQISITESQISNLGSYATTTNFNSHTGNTNCHFTQASISITTSQISNLSSYTGFDSRYVQGVNTGKITVASTAPASPATGDLWVDTSA